MSELEQIPALRRGPADGATMVGDLARRALALAALAALAACTAVICVDAAAVPSFLVPSSAARFPGWIAGVYHGLAGGPLSEGSFSALMLAAFAFYLVALMVVRSVSLQLVGAIVVLLHVLAALSPPLNLTDLFNYLGFARLGAIHHLNPYAHGVIAVPGDPVVPFDSWRHLHSPYGPLFTLLSYAVAPLGVPAGLWVLKGLAAVSSLGCVALLGVCARRLGRDPVPAVALFGLNPLVIIFGVGGGHIDFMMLALLLGGIALTLGGRDPGGAVATVAAIGFKATAAIVLPFQLLGSHRRRPSLVAAALAAAMAAGVSLAAFGPSLLGGLRTQGQCISKLSVPDTVGRIVGAGGAVTAIRVLFLAILAAVVVRQLLRTRPGQWITPAGWATFALLASLTWLMPWYVASLIPLAALSSSRGLKAATIVACAFSLLVWLPDVNTTIAGALPRATPHLAGGCTTRGVHQEPHHPGWAQGYL